MQFLQTTDFKLPKLIFFESGDHYLASRQAALYFFGRAIANTTLQFGEAKFPYWYYITSDVTKGAAISRSGSLLVLDNLSTTSSSSVRMEKLRDCVNFYADTTMILLFQGYNSVEWSRDNLGVRPYGVVHFDGYKHAESPASVIKI